MTQQPTQPSGGGDSARVPALRSVVPDGELGGGAARQAGSRRQPGGAATATAALTRFLMRSLRDEAALHRRGRELRIARAQDDAARADRRVAEETAASLVSHSLGVSVLDVSASLASTAASLAALLCIIAGNTLLAVFALEYLALPSRTAVIVGVGVGFVQTLMWHGFGATFADAEAAARNPGPAAVVESAFDDRVGKSLKLTAIFLIAVTSWLCAGRTAFSPDELLPSGSDPRFLLALFMFVMVLLMLNAFAALVGFRTAGAGARAIRRARSTARRARERGGHAARSEARLFAPAARRRWVTPTSAPPSFSR